MCVDQVVDVYVCNDESVAAVCIYPAEAFSIERQGWEWRGFILDRRRACMCVRVNDGDSNALPLSRPSRSLFSSSCHKAQELEMDLVRGQRRADDTLDCTSWI